MWNEYTKINNGDKNRYINCSIDYDKNSDTTQQFYATVQNKFHYAITGNTAAEIYIITAKT